MVKALTKEVAIAPAIIATVVIIATVNFCEKPAFNNL